MLSIQRLNRSKMLKTFVSVSRSRSLATIVEKTPVHPDIQNFWVKNEITINHPAPHEFPPMLTFKDTPFYDPIHNVFQTQGYSAPTPIQAQAWPIVLKKHDIISVARTGSGKTCGFLIPAIHDIMDQISKEDGKRRFRLPKVLVLAPTRELSVQIQVEAQKYAQAARIQTVCLYGGASRFPQIQALRRGAEIVVATPGRCNDLVESGALDLSEVKYLVLDEADRMLDMGFEPQIRQIVDQIPRNRQTLFFTATWPREVQALAKTFLSDNAVHLTVGEVGSLTANRKIVQKVEVVKELQKERRLFEVLQQIKESSQSNAIPKVLIFVARKVTAADLSRDLNQEGFRTDCLHGDMGQESRDRAMERFRRGLSRMLVATDVAARGIDIKDIDVVINYDFPNEIENYVHRIGRTARADNEGRSYSFLTPIEASKMGGSLIDVMEKAYQHVPPELEPFRSQKTSQRTGQKYRSLSQPMRPNYGKDTRGGGDMRGGGGGMRDRDQNRPSSDRFSGDRGRFSGEREQRFSQSRGDRGGGAWNNNQVSEERNNRSSERRGGDRDRGRRSKRDDGWDNFDRDNTW